MKLFIVGIVLAVSAAFVIASAVALNPAFALGYAASGTHRCGNGGACVVTGSGFANCLDAATALKPRDCCPTTRQGGTSSGFTLNYCIPDRSR